MRLALRTTLILLLAYALALGVVAAFVLAEVRTSELEIEREASRLVGREVAAALSEPSLERLMLADRATREQLRVIIHDVTGPSSSVRSITVVDRRGRVVASDDLRTGSTLPVPAEVFPGGEGQRFFDLPDGAYALEVPLRMREDLVGYLRLTLASDQLANIGARARTRLIWIGSIGMLVIVLIGVTLHYHLIRRGRAIVRALEGAAAGEPQATVDEPDEFSQALAAARRAGLALHDERARRGESRHKLETLARAMETGVLLIGTGRSVELSNARVRDQLGCADDAAIERVLARLAPQLDPALARLREGAPEPVRADLTVEGRPMRFELSRAGDGALVMVRDRRSLGALETDLRQATQLRGLNRVYRAAAHDIRGPLGVMGIQLELLKRSMNGGQATERPPEEYVRTIGLEMSRLNRLIDGLLKQGETEDDPPGPFDLVKIVREIEAFVGPACRQRKVALEVRCPEGPVLVAGQRDALKQAILNLVLNGLDAIDESSPQDPERGRLVITLGSAPSEAVLEVRDSGPGIPPEVLDRIFTMHYTTKQSGTGIGLFIARAIVESHGGEIRVDPGLGRGAAFAVTLPITAAVPREEHAQRADRG
jgi:signal transduction histidine kinase